MYIYIKINICCQICQNVQSGGWTREYDDVHKVPFAYNNKDWVGYDDIPSITEKVRYLPVCRIYMLIKHEIYRINLCWLTSFTNSKLLYLSIQCLLN